jgi:DNA gyrase subunit A
MSDNTTEVLQSPEISIETEMKKSYLDYAMSVIIGRALPDVRDGLKPVHRRVLYAMRELKNDYNKPYKKSARIVGDVIGKYHPHGDSAVYDTIVRLAQDFSMRYPLVDGQGNFGSIDGDPAAAMRYTEIRMMRLAHEMLEDLDKETVNTLPNYDESLTEPSVLAGQISCPAGQRIVRNCRGHGHQYSSSQPFRGDRRDQGPDRQPGDYLRGTHRVHIPGPDFPTAGIIHGIQGIRDAYEDGPGHCPLACSGDDIEEDKKTGQETIAVTEIPYQVNKARLIEKIAELMKHKVIEGLRYVRDESDRRGMRIAMGVKKDHMAGVIINQLYKHTQMASSFGIILLAVVNNRPQVLNLKQILEHFVLHRKEIVIRRTRFDLNKAEARAHILEGLTVALDNLDAVVKLIRDPRLP